MARNDVHTCSNCSTIHRQQLSELALVVCVKCGKPIKEVPSANYIFYQMPEDFSFIQIGTTGEFKKQSFQVVGRVRLQLRNEYKNFWSASDPQGKLLWVVESFGSISVFTSPVERYTEHVEGLRAGTSILINETLLLKGEFVDKIESASMQGEIGAWFFFEGTAFIIQAGKSNYTAYFFPLGPKQSQMLIGEKASIESLNLKNTVTLDEWKSPS